MRLVGRSSFGTSGFQPLSDLHKLYLLSQLKLVLGLNMKIDLEEVGPFYDLDKDFQGLVCLANFHVARVGGFLDVHQGQTVENVPI